MLNRILCDPNYFVASMLIAASLAVSPAAMGGTETYTFGTNGSLADSGGKNALVVSNLAGTSTTPDSGYSYNVTGGRLELVADAAPAAAPSGIVLTTPFSVSGDFTASVNINLGDGSSNDSYDFAFKANGADGYVDFASGGDTVSAGPNGYFRSTQSVGAYGTFTLMRAGDELTASYSAGGSTVNSENVTSASVAGSTTFSLDVQNPANTNGGVADATFEDFTMTSASLPEPTSMGIVVLGGLTLMRRRPGA